MSTRRLMLACQMCRTTVDLPPIGSHRIDITPADDWTIDTVDGVLCPACSALHIAAPTEETR